MKSRVFQLPKKIRVTLVVIVIFAVTLIVLTVPSYRHTANQFLKDSFTRQPNRLTELYFINNGHLPATYTPEVPIKLPFAIKNLETIDVIYRYRILVNGVEDSSLSGSVTSTHGSIIEPAVTVVPHVTDLRVQLTIELIDQHQSIHVWVERAS